MLHIWTESRVSEADPHTVMLMEGHPRFTRLLVPNDQLQGWDTYFIELKGWPVDVPRGDAPVWQFALPDGPITLELAYVGAWRPPAPMMALIQWAPGARLSQSIEITSDEWSDADLSVAAYALRRLHGRVAPKRGLSNEEAFAEAVGFAMQWLKDDPRREPEDLDEAALARRMGIEPASLRTQMTRKKYGIKKVRQELIRRVPKSP